MPDYQFSAVIVDLDWARANQAVLVAYWRALRAGTAYMFAHPDEAAEIGATELQTMVASAGEQSTIPHAWISCRRICF